MKEFNKLFLVLLVYINNCNTLMRLYNSDHLNHNKLIDNNCLFYKVLDDIVDYTNDRTLISPHEIISYCFRSSSIDDNLDNKWRISDKNMTFKQLRMNNVSSNQLLSWSAPMDLIERYEDYLNNPDKKNPYQIYYNCTLPRFGELCQYTFESSNSFNLIVKSTFKNKASNKNEYTPLDFNKLTCFKHVKCYRGPSPMCLDWREVCDGIVDCTDGIDEKNCFELDLKECAPNEYRCHNRLCISVEFIDDDWLNPDCLDGTDEVQAINSDPYTQECYQDPAFRCEERGKPQGQGFACGDGQFSSISIIGANVGYICKNGRDETFNRAVSLLDNNKNLSYKCWLSTICNHPFRRYVEGDCEMWDESFPYYEESYYDLGCSKDFIFPNYPVFLGHIRYALSQASTEKAHYIPSYICYNEQFCPSLSLGFFIEGWSCTTIGNHKGIWDNVPILAKSIASNCMPLSFNENSTYCHIENTYRCINSSKCIFKHQLVDGIRDCPYGDDEKTGDSCILDDKYRFRCTSENKCLSRWLLFNGENDCVNGEDENINVPRVLGVLFVNICNGIEETTLPIVVNGKNETDETNCEQWPCDNQYTRCNGYWDCLNGIDETGCDNSLCSYGHHPCVSVKTYEFICLPQAEIGDNIIDCLGSYDERDYCRTRKSKRPDRRFRCDKTPSCTVVHSLCKSQISGCSQDNKTILCNHLSAINEKCFGIWSFLCDNQDRWPIPVDVHFQLEDDKSIVQRSFQSSNYQLQEKTNTIIDENVLPKSLKDVTYEDAWLCNRGIVVRTSMQKEALCLCPPSYYGYRCENQNERVSVTLKLRKEYVSDSWRQVYYIMIMLIDNTYQIHSYDYFIFGSTTECIFNVYLLYLTRPKDMNKTYHVLIDAYLINDFTLYASWLLPVSFLFLPVNRIVTSLFVPPKRITIENDCKIVCVHGQCMTHVNSPKQYCRCKTKWFGARCDISYDCNCSPDSLCISTVNNRSICMCPAHKFGPRCLLNRTICQSNTCLNGGICVLDDERIISNIFRCICPPGYSGSRCELVDTLIHFEFRDVSIPSILFLHYITISDDENPKKFDKNYYLTVVEKHYNSSRVLSKTITKSDRCQSIEELFNSTFILLPTLHRVKYYHQPCRQNRNLRCLYDDQLMCLCNSFRHANCFEFKRNILHECRGNGYCLNGGECFQDRPDCPSKLMCACSKCFCGTRCQLTTEGFSISLDSILGYSIRPKANFGEQITIIKMSGALIIIMFIIGLINGVLSLLVFRGKTARSIGCGWYLLGTSINSIVVMAMLVVKFCLLLLSHMGTITNRSVIFGHCISVDFLIRACLSINYWLSAFVSIERMMTVIKGVSFNKKSSIKMAKWVVIVLPILIIVSSIQEVIYHSLIDDSEETRIWCVIIYPHRSIELVNWFMHVCQVVIPFLINFIATLIIVIMIARQHSVSRIDQTYQEHLYKQFIQQKHLLLTPLILVSLNIPRLIVSFIPTCMNTIRDPYFFLFSYLIAFAPPMLTFIIFVLPSKAYKDEFHLVTKRIFLF